MEVSRRPIVELPPAGQRHRAGRRGFLSACSGANVALQRLTCIRVWHFHCMGRKELGRDYKCDVPLPLPAHWSGTSSREVCAWLWRLPNVGPYLAVKVVASLFLKGKVVMNGAPMGPGATEAVEHLLGLPHQAHRTGVWPWGGHQQLLQLVVDFSHVNRVSFFDVQNALCRWKQLGFKLPPKVFRVRLTGKGPPTRPHTPPAVVHTPPAVVCPGAAPVTPQPARPQPITSPRCATSAVQTVDGVAEASAVDGSRSPLDAADRREVPATSRRLQNDVELPPAADARLQAACLAMEPMSSSSASGAVEATASEGAASCRQHDVEFEAEDVLQESRRWTHETNRRQLPRLKELRKLYQPVADYVASRLDVQQGTVFVACVELYAGQFLAATIEEVGPWDPAMVCALMSLAFKATAVGISAGDPDYDTVMEQVWRPGVWSAIRKCSAEAAVLNIVRFQGPRQMLPNC